MFLRWKIGALHTKYPLSPPSAPRHAFEHPQTLQTTDELQKNRENKFQDSWPGRHSMKFWGQISPSSSSRRAPSVLWGILSCWCKGLLLCRGLASPELGQLHAFKDARSYGSRIASPHTVPLFWWSHKSLVISFYNQTNWTDWHPFCQITWELDKHIFWEGQMKKRPQGI